MHNLMGFDLEEKSWLPHTESKGYIFTVSNWWIICPCHSLAFLNASSLHIIYFVSTNNSVKIASEDSSHAAMEAAVTREYSCKQLVWLIIGIRKWEVKGEKRKNHIHIVANLIKSWSSCFISPSMNLQSFVWIVLSSLIFDNSP